jgi:hypothetical protein
MNRRRPAAVVVGASIGGLVAAVELRCAGWDVTVMEKSRSLGGLYAKVGTPFGECELGMHVLYVNEAQAKILQDLIGPDALIEKRGVAVDLGASWCNGRLSTGSHYPDLRNWPGRAQALAQLAISGPIEPQANAADELRHRFGAEPAAQVQEILEKLWQQPAEALSPAALHCYFDLRRIVLADKPEADALKQSSTRLDETLANPDQTRPVGAVFGGRRALFFRPGIHDSAERMLARLQELGIEVLLGSDVHLHDDQLMSGTERLSDRYQACIVASPLSALDSMLAQRLDSLELSICYVQVAADYRLPTYYVLCHDAALSVSRIVNYAAYNFTEAPHLQRLFAVETLHACGQPPSAERIVAELKRMMPELAVEATHVHPRALRIATPSLRNAVLQDERVRRLQQCSGFARPPYFAGMRTDQGVFFSHQTIGAAHAAALDCIRRQT